MMADTPATYSTEPPVVQAQPVYHHHEEIKEKRTRSAKKKPRASRHIELMEWLPTLPQLFAYMGFTQFLLMFWVFIAECANDVGDDWHLVMMWITVWIVTALFAVYMFLVIKRRIVKSITSVLFAFVAFLFMFYRPIHPTYKRTISSAGMAVVSFFRMLIIGLVLVIYLIAYIEDLKPEPAETVVVTNTTVVNNETRAEHAS